MTKPFSESACFEQGNIGDPFYATGSNGSIGETPGSFSRSLFNKEQIKLSFAVTSRTTMLPNSCSIYYFSPVNGSWALPANALSDIRGPIEKIGLTSSGRPGASSLSQFFIEDYVAFNYKGIPLVSGSQSVYRTAPSTGPWVQRVSDMLLFDSNAETKATDRNEQSGYMTGDYPKTVNRNPDYIPATEQTFTLPLERPFLVEKVVLEIPFCLGNGWLYDKTTSCYVTASREDSLVDGIATADEVYFFEQGGPGITVALYSKKLYGSGSVLDLITKNFVTHANDTNKEIKVRRYFDNPYKINFDINGINSSSVDTVLNLTPPNAFTGSVVVKSEVKNSNGVNVYFHNTRYTRTMTQFNVFATGSVGDKYFKPANSAIGGVDAFGRAATGFAPSGGSIFGGEYSTAGVDSFTIGGEFQNPHYIEDATLRQQTINKLGTSFSAIGLLSPSTSITMTGDVFIGSSKNSPYLIYPGEKLLLAISKTRPAMATMKINFTTAGLAEGKGQLLSSSYYNDLKGALGHDIQLNSGSINMTFYGSYVRAGDSYTP